MLQNLTDKTLQYAVFLQNIFLKGYIPHGCR